MMQTSLRSTVAEGLPQETKPVFRCLIVYEEFEWGLRAMQVYNAIVNEFGHEYEFTVNLWKFDVLRIEQISELAAREAAEADLIILAAPNRNVPPPELRAWAEKWVARRSKAESALVGLLSQSDIPHNAPSLRQFLQSIASRGRMKLLMGETSV